MKIEDIERAAEVKRQLGMVEKGLDVLASEQMIDFRFEFCNGIFLNPNVLELTFGCDEQEVRAINLRVLLLLGEELLLLRIAREDELTEMGIE